MKDQYDCVLNVLEELGNKQLFLKHQCSTGIFIFSPPPAAKHAFPSIYQTNEQIVEMDSEDFPSFSRNEPLHHLLDVLSENDEEDESLSSTHRIRRENVSLVQCQSNSSFQWGLFLVKSQQVLFFVVLLLPLIGLQNLSHPVVTFVLRADLQEFLFHCCSSSSQTYLIREKV